MGVYSGVFWVSGGNPLDSASLVKAIHKAKAHCVNDAMEEAKTLISRGPR